MTFGGRLLNIVKNYLLTYMYIYVIILSQEGIRRKIKWHGIMEHIVVVTKEE